MRGALRTRVAGEVTVFSAHGEASRLKFILFCCTTPRPQRLLTKRHKCPTNTHWHRLIHRHVHGHTLNPDTGPTPPPALLIAYSNPAHLPLSHSHNKWHRSRSHGHHKNSSTSSCCSLETRLWGRAASCCVSPISSGCPRMKQARRSGLTFGCVLRRWLARLETCPPSLFSVFIDVGILLVFQVHKLEVRGRKVKMSIWVRGFLLSSERERH
jgi:hypothetical protein